MRLFITNGMFGDKIGFINECKDETDLGLVISEWKKANSEKYRVCPYEVYTIGKDNTIAIDFGDYSTFMLVEDPDHILTGGMS